MYEYSDLLCFLLAILNLNPFVNQYFVGGFRGTLFLEKWPQMVSKWPQKPPQMIPKVGKLAITDDCWTSPIILYLPIQT